MHSSHTHPLHPHPHYNHLRSSSPSRSPTHSPKSVKRRSLPSDDEFPFAYDFPQYTYVPPPSPVLDPLFPSTSSSGSSSTSGSSTAKSKSSVTKSGSQPIASASPIRDQAPPPASARFFNNHTPYPSTAPISYPSGFTSDANRARGPSFASTTSYTSSTTSSGSSSGAPATPPRSNHLLTLGSPSSSRLLRPYWERSYPLTGDEEDDRLDEVPEDELREKELRRDVLETNPDELEENSSDEEFGYDARRESTDAEFARYMAYLSPSLSSALSGQPQPQPRPRSVRRSPFCDDDPSQPQNFSHVYLDDDITPTGARRSSGSIRMRKMDSPRSVARSSSLTQGHGRASPRRLSSPIVMNSLSRIGSGSGSGSRPQSPALSAHSPSNSSTHSLAYSTLPLNSNVRGYSPSPLHLPLPVRDISNSPSLNLPERSPDVDASPLRTALLLNSGPDLSPTRTSSGQPYEERAGDRRFSGRGLGLNGFGYGGGSCGLELQGLGGGPGAINAALARRRAEWTEFEGDEYSSSGYDVRTTSGARHHAPLPHSRLRNEEEFEVDLGSRSSRFGYGQGGLNLNLNDDSGDPQDEEVQGSEKDERRANVDLSSPRTSLTFSRPHPYALVSSPTEKRRSVSQPRGGVSYTYAYGVEPDHTDDERHSLHASRPSTSGQQSANNDGNEKGTREKGDGAEDDRVPTCFAIQWGLRARWAALKLRVRLGAFRTRRRVGLA